MRSSLKLLAFCSLLSTTALSQKLSLNIPIIQTKYTVGPAPIVYDDTIYLFTSCDGDDGENSHIKDWLLYTSTSMMNWQGRDAVASLRDSKWCKGNNGAWAQRVARRNGKRCMYYPIHGNGIGMLVSDSPYGPFRDPINKPLVWQEEHWYDIDPTICINDGGQAYMYWGNPNLYCMKLSEDMVPYSGEVIELPHIEDYWEGPWLYKRNRHCYSAFASTCCPEGIDYAMNENPLGPWEYKGHIMDHTPRTRGNHPGIINYKDESYCFEQNYNIFHLETSRRVERRSVSIAETEYNPNGIIRILPYFHECKLGQIKKFDPYREAEAETVAWGFGLKTTPKGTWNRERWSQLVTGIDDGGYLMVKGVDFRKKAKTFKVSASTHLYSGILEIHTDQKDGPCIDTVNTSRTESKLREFMTSVANLNGVYNLYLVLKSGRELKKNLFMLDWWAFE